MIGSKGNVAGEAHQSQQLLSPPQEAVLYDWIEFCALIAKPLDVQGVLSLIAELSGKLPGKHWLHRFKKRWPQVSYSRPGGLDPKQAYNFNPSNVAGFFELLKVIYDAYPNLPPQHVWNMDEKGLQLGGGHKQSKRFFHLESLKRSKFYCVHSDNLELVTIIECISPAGLSVPPAFILAQGPIPALPDLDVPIGAVAMSPNGWTDNKLGLKWFQETFIPFATAHKINDAPILLLLDGHDSHETDKLRTLAYDHNIFILAFPSKCTHKLQPLDIMVFAQVQCQWSSHCDRHIIENIAIDRYSVIPEYMKVRAASMKPKLIRSAFSCTSILPFNPHVFTNVDFAPARSFSIIPQVPGSFPVDIPSSSPVPSNVSDSASSCSDLSSDKSEGQSDTNIHPLSMDWEMDSDDDDTAYKPPSSHGSSLSLTHFLPSTSSSYISVPSLFSVPMSPMLTDTSAHAKCTPSISEAEQVDDLPVNTDTPNHNASHHMTHLQNTASSTALSISAALDHNQAPIPKSMEELNAEIIRLQMTCNFLEQELIQVRANTEASDAHCTIMKRAESDARAQLLGKKNKSHRAIKTSAHYIAYETLKEIHAHQTQEKAERARENTAKEAQKAEEEAVCKAQIWEETTTRIFTGVSPLDLFFLA